MHRDLKPENLLLTDAGRVKIADFGIAKAVDHVATTEFATAAGTTVGTPTYMAPEQAMGKDLTPATDLYSLGVIAYELMVGRLPFEAESPVALLLRHVTDSPPPPLSVNPDLDPELGAWIERLLVKDPEQRTATAEQAWDELEDIVFRMLGHRWRREATIPDPRTFLDEPPPPDVPSQPATDDVSRYLTVDPSRFDPSRPPVGGTDDQPTAVARDPVPPPPPPPATPAPAGQVPGPWTPPPSDMQPPVPGPWTPPPSEAPPAQQPPAGWTPPPSEAPPAQPTPWPQSGPPQAVPGAVSPPTPPPFTPPPLDATVAPSNPLLTPAPIEATKEPKPRSGMRRVVWVAGLLVLATVAAAVVMFARPSSDPTSTATPTPSADGAAGRRRGPAQLQHRRVPADALGRLGEPCLEQAKCGTARTGKNQRRSAFVKGTGPESVSLVIDRTRLSPAADVSLNEIIEEAEQPLFATVSGYDRAKGMPRRITLPPDREAMELSFTSREPERPAGTVFAFKHKNDVYVINARGPDPATTRDEAIRAVDGLEPR